MVDDKRGSQDQPAEDVARVLQDATNNLMELDARLQQMRRDISGLLHAASATGPGAGAAQNGPHGADPMVPLHAAASTSPWMGSGTMPSPMGGASMPGGPSFGTWSVRDFRARPPLAREPQADLIDAGSEFILQLELPGVRKEDLDIMATERAVVVTAEYRPEMEDGGVVVLGERGPITYRRSFPLPIEIQTKECQARLKDGILTLRVPKKTPSAGAHHVNVAYS